MYQNSYWTMSSGLQKRIYFLHLSTSLCPKVKQKHTQVLLYNAVYFNRIASCTMLITVVRKMEVESRAQWHTSLIPVTRSGDLRPGSESPPSLKFFKNYWCSSVVQHHLFRSPQGKRRGKKTPLWYLSVRNVLGNLRKLNIWFYLSIQD